MGIGVLNYALTPRRLTIGRVEALAAVATINSYYLAPQGMARSNGLSIGGKPDFLGIAAWVVDIYMGQRLAGVSPDAAWQRVVFEIQQTDQWKTTHRPVR